MLTSLRRALARALPAALLVSVALSGTAHADWVEPVGAASPINKVATKSATNSDLATVAGVPYVAWNEDTTSGGGSSSTIHVSRLNADGSGWQPVADAGTNPISRLDSTSSEHPSLADVQGTPWVAWDEGLTATNSEIRVARLAASGTSWQRVPDTLRPINHLRTDPGGLAQYPTLVSDGTARPYVSFFESDPGSGSLFFGSGQDPARIWVMRLSADGTTWDEVGGGPVNAIPDYDAAFPRMTIIDGTPWVTYFQVAVVSGSPQIQVRVAHLVNGAWQQAGDPVAVGAPDGTIDSPDIAAVGGVAYVAIPERGTDSTNRVHVYRWSGSAWTAAGIASPTGIAAQNAAITDIGGNPWVSWRQRSNGSASVGTSRLVGGSWSMAGTPVSHAGGDVTAGPALADVNGIPWVSFTENDNQTPGSNTAPACCGQVRVSRLEPTFGTVSGQPTDTQATLLTTVEGYGLPYKIGFRYGAGSTLTQSTTPKAATDGLVYDVVSGLQPSTLYSFRPYATAGTPAPPVLGPAANFVTDPLSGVTAPPVVAILDRGYRVPRGHRVRIRFVATLPGQAILRIRHHHRVLVTKRADVPAGVSVLRWSGRVAGVPVPLGRYRAAVILRTPDGARAKDHVTIRVVRRH